MVTLHHFTDPLWFSALGAWENSLAEDYFGRFVGRVVEALGDQVSLWCTVNEPVVYAFNGYVEGTFPPGVRNIRRAFRVLRHFLLAHGRAYRTIHRLQGEARVGLAHHVRMHLPARPRSGADRAAATMMNHLSSRCVLEAITSGRLLPPLGTGQLAPILIDSCDFIGLNHYTTIRTALDVTRPSSLGVRTYYDPEIPQSDLTPLGIAYGEVNPDGLYQALKHVAAYRKPVFITEHGLPDRDDDQRPGYLASCLAEAWRAIRDGVDLRGYYHWTLVDNFEWAAGWDLRFGLFSLDTTTGVRTAGNSAAVYSRIARANGVSRRLLQQLAPGLVSRYA
jgi:beta-glucosidase